MNQADLQREMDRLAWTGKTYILPEKVKLTGPGPLRIYGCHLEGWHTAAPQYAGPSLATLEVTNTATPAVEVYGPHAGLAAAGQPFRLRLPCGAANQKCR